MATQEKKKEGIEITEIPWDFLSEEMPDLMKAPMDEVKTWIKSLPDTEEVKENLLSNIENAREERNSRTKDQP